jgi:hypothetical protein
VLPDHAPRLLEAPRTLRRSTPARHTAAPSPAASDAVEILVDVREARAIHAFIESARRGRFGVLVRDDAPVAADADALHDIVINPIDITAPGDNRDDKGARQW